MLVFDALIGHNDRHPYNWGIVVPLRKSGAPRFSPIFDTARALFWNVPERRIVQMLNDENQFEAYVRRCAPPVGWDGEPAVDFFRLIGLIWNSFKQYQRNIEKLLADNALRLSLEMIDREFVLLMSADRRELIKRCLHLRQQYLCDAVRKFKGKGETK